MPYKFETEKKKIPRELNRNVKLSQEEREKIKDWYGKISQRKLAKMFNVSRRLIIFIGCPEKARISREQFLQRQKERRYYSKEKQREYIKTHRRYKRKLDLKGLLEKNG